jgi:hypothetical protein
MAMMRRSDRTYETRTTTRDGDSQRFKSEINDFRSEFCRGD